MRDQYKIISTNERPVSPYQSYQEDISRKETMSNARDEEDVAEDDEEMLGSIVTDKAHYIQEEQVLE